MEEERRYSKEDEALEIKSLRRIISAYLNYADAAEEDVKRYEKSYRRLSPSHKALLHHLPLKFQRLRRCITTNMFFIMNMLQAFEPPLDMSQVIDIDENEHVENALDCQCYSQTAPISGPNGDSTWKPLTSRRCNASGTELSGFTKVSNEICESFGGSNENEGMDTESSCKAIMNKCTAPEHHTNICCGIQDDDKFAADPPAPDPDPCSFDSSANGNVSSASRDWMDPSLQTHVPLVDVDKVRCIIRNIVRDWAAEGQMERDQCYKPILEELNRLFPDRSIERPPSCLVPGAGLGRLALEISSLGFVSQGNEFSYYMMICSSFILNQTQTANEWVIYPWIHSNCNSFSDNDQLRPVSFPDILPTSAGITEGFSMCAGDFVEVYNDASQEASWDEVTTCFFLDTAHNIVEYIEIISKLLKNGGVWINLGPLLYHFADTYGVDDDMSIELSLEDVKKIAVHYGFELEMEKFIETTYTANPQSMMQDPKSRKMIGTGTEHNGVYWLDGVPLSAAAVAASHLQWHRRLGHPLHYCYIR